MDETKNFEELKKQFFAEGVRLARETGFISLDEVRKNFPNINFNSMDAIELIEELCKGFSSVEE